MQQQDSKEKNNSVKETDRIRRTKLSWEKRICPQLQYAKSITMWYNKESYKNRTALQRRGQHTHYIHATVRQSKASMDYPNI